MDVVNLEMNESKVGGKFSILRVVRHFAPTIGGSITHIVELSRAMDPHLKKQIIVAPHIPDCESFDKKFSIPIIRVKSPAICYANCPVIAEFLYSLYAKKVIAQAIEDYNVDIVHIHSPFLASYLIPQIRLKDRNLHCVVMVHGWPEKKARPFKFSYGLGKLLIRLSSPDRYLILNDGSQIFDLQEVLCKANIPWDIVYHGIDTSLFKPNNINDCKHFTILFPHRPVPIKKPDIALKIFEKLSSKIGSSTACLTYLAANHADGLKQLTVDQGLGSSVFFKNDLSGESLIKCFNRSSVVIGTSLNSNTGRAIQEAMACAKPVIVFNNGGISNLITNMENGILVEPGDIDGFVDALEIMYHNPELRKELGRKAREKIIQERSWNKRIEKELLVYEQIMEKAPNNPMIES